MLQVVSQINKTLRVSINSTRDIALEIPTTPESLAMQRARSIQHSVMQSLIIQQINRQKAERLTAITVDSIARTLQG